MNFIQKLNQLIDLYLVAIKSFGKLRSWLPFLVYALLQFLVLLVCASYDKPLFNTLLYPLVALMGAGKAEYFSHYPGLFVMLPAVFQGGKIILSLIFEGVAIGLTVILLLKAFSPAKGKEYKVAYVFSRWPELMLISAIVTTIWFAAGWGIPSLFSGFLAGSPRRIALFDILLKIIIIILYSIFIYTIPAFIIYRKKIWEAFRFSLSYFRKQPFFSFFLVMFPYLLTIPISYMTSRANVVVAKFTPELVLYILLTGIVVDFIINFVLTGAVVKLLTTEEE
ncbi:MAG: hypothetical protein NTV06_01055 [candidate division Zixibacteria bacterium]|nr:hypothetical protein [candidate division Zixibacteria bacterium]